LVHRERRCPIINSTTPLFCAKAMKHKGKWGFIVNPAAGRGAAAGYMTVVREAIARLGLRAVIAVTEGRRHAEALASRLVSDGCDPIIAVGGDGTVNEVANGIIGRDVTLGVVPAGSGNDFIHALGFPARFSRTDWALLCRADAIEMDVGLCNDRYFVNGMGFGFDAQVAASREREGARRGYLLHILKHLLRYRPRLVRVVVNGQVHRRRCFLKTIGIGRRFGGGYYLTAQAVANDGVFDVCTVDDLSLLQRARLLPRVPRGTHVSDPVVEYFRTDRLEIEADEELPYHLDGEIFRGASFCVRILPRKLRVIYNPAGEHYFRIDKSARHVLS